VILDANMMKYRGFHIAKDMPLDHMWVRKRRVFQGPNVWPPEAVLPRLEFRQPIETYYTAMMELAHKVIELIARTLPYGAHVFDNFRSQDPLAILRLLHYPPATKTGEGRPQFGASAHTDFGAVTLLLQDGTAGLEVLDQAKDEWIPVPPVPDTYVINVGDMLSKWTGSKYKSSWHRVLNKNPKDRYSIVFFYDGNLDCPLSPLDGSQADGAKILTVEEHMINRLTESYGGKK
jgi:isopenicillin N synthase-like dioxygenase